MLVSRFETRGKKYWLELHRTDSKNSLGVNVSFWSYMGDGCGGNFGELTEDDANSQFADRVASYEMDGHNMRQVSGEKLQELETSRERIAKTKALSIDDRIAILRRIIDEIGFPKNDAESRKFSRRLEREGYMPMMFAAASRALIAERREKQTA